MDTKEALLNAMLGEALNSIETNVTSKVEEVETQLNARLEGIKAMAMDGIDKVEAIIDKKPFSINLGTIEKPKTKTVHSAFKLITKILAAAKRKEKNIMMVGEAGSGKTQLARNIAEALKLEYYPMSVGLQTTKSDLLGFINAQGNYVTTPVRKAYENGGVLLLDEFDATHAGVVTILNSLLANGHCSFPDKIVEKNPNFICICACNTYGRGGNINYVGRNRLDAATLDRFIVVDVGYDNKLEKILTKNDAWNAIVKQIRKNIDKQGIKMIVSPRASMDGADLLDAGFKPKEVFDMVICKGCDDDTKKKLLQDVDLDTLIPETPTPEPKKEEKKETKKESKADVDIVLVYDYQNNTHECVLNCEHIRNGIKGGKCFDVYTDKEKKNLIRIENDFIVYGLKNSSCLGTNIVYANPENKGLLRRDISDERTFTSKDMIDFFKNVQSSEEDFEAALDGNIIDGNLSFKVTVINESGEHRLFRFDTKKEKQEQLELEF